MIKELDSTDIPDDLDVFFREFYGDYFEGPPEQIIYKSLQDSDISSGKALFTPEQLIKFAKEGTEIMFGDIDLSTPLLKVSVAGAVAAGGYFSAVKAQGSSRRRLLQSVTISAATWLASSLTPLMLIYGDEKRNAFNRVKTRIHGLISHFHPEDAHTFLRNAVMADKLLEIGKEKREDNKEVPRIAFNAGRAHSGIEDFLILGQAACRDIIIAAFSLNPRLKKTISSYDLERFCSARLLKFTTDFNPNNLKRTITEEDSKISYPNLQVQDRIVTDIELLQKLQR